MRKYLSIICTVVAMMMVTTAKALGTEEAPYVLQDGVNDLHVAAFMEPVNAVYEATADGTVDIIMWYERFDPVCNGETAMVTGAPPTYFAQVVDVKKGDKVYFTKEWAQNDNFQIIVQTLENGQKPAIMPIDFTPKDNQVYPWNTAGEVTVQFNRSVVVGSAYLKIGSQKFPAADLRTNGSFVSCNIKNVLNQKLADGTITPGKRFQVSFEGICDAYDPSNLYGGNGVLLLNFAAPQPQSELESTNFNQTEAEMKSFYNPGGEEGLFILTFTNDLNDKYNQTSVSLLYGDVDQAIAGYYYHENVPYSIEGNKLIVDLRGKIRTQASMWPNADQTTEVPETIDTEHLYLSVHNVQDINGNFVNAPGAGSVGSFTFMLKLTKIDMTDFYMDLMPATSDTKPSAINAGDKIDFWFSDPHLFTLGTPMGFDVYVGEEKVKEIYYHYVIDEYNEEAEEHIYSTGVNEDAPIEFIEQDGGKSVVLTLPELESVEPGTVIRLVAVGISTADGIEHDYHATYTYGADTAIENVNANENANENRYNIAGQRVGKEFKGIVIIGGKKTVSSL